MATVSLVRAWLLVCAVHGAVEQCSPCAPCSSVAQCALAQQCPDSAPFVCVAGGSKGGCNSDSNYWPSAHGACEVCCDARGCNAPAVAQPEPGAAAVAQPEPVAAAAAQPEPGAAVALITTAAPTTAHKFILFRLLVFAFILFIVLGAMCHKVTCCSKALESAMGALCLLPCCSKAWQDYDREKRKSKFGRARRMLVSQFVSFVFKLQFMKSAPFQFNPSGGGRQINPVEADTPPTGWFGRWLGRFLGHTYGPLEPDELQPTSSTSPPLVTSTCDEHHPVPTELFPPTSIGETGQQYEDVEKLPHARLLDAVSRYDGSEEHGRQLMQELEQAAPCFWQLPDVDAVEHKQEHERFHKLAEDKYVSTEL